MAMQYLSIYERALSSFTMEDIGNVMRDIARGTDSFQVREFRAVIRRDHSRNCKALSSLARERDILQELNQSEFIPIVYVGDWRYLSLYLSRLQFAVRIIDGQNVFAILRSELSRLPRKFFKICIK
jgi:hypothetical protein